MHRTLIAAAAAAILIATPALAHHCPKDAAAIDAALQSHEVAADERASIVALRDEGMAAHEAGDHAAAETALAEAMRRLLLAIS